MKQHVKPRISKELYILLLLKRRVDFPAHVYSHYERLQNGYEGELSFYRFMEENLTVDSIVLYDLLFRYGGSTFQIDCLLICGSKVFLFEVKNFGGDYLIQDEDWYSVKTKQEISNPLHQLRRTEHLFRQMLKQITSRFSLETRLVFVNPNFFLYHAPLQLPALFPTQIDRYFKELNRGSSVITNFHRDLADKLVKKHVDEHPFERIPKYDYEDLKKGIPCLQCDAFMERANVFYMICPSCQTKEKNEHAIVRLATEFQTLFPNEPITSSIISDFSGELFSLYTVRNALQKNFTYYKKGNRSFFKATES